MGTNYGMASVVSLVLVAPVLLLGCSSEQQPVLEAAPRPVKSVVVDTPDVGGVRRFPGRIDALNKAEVAFRVPGTVQELPVKEGDRVKTGDLLAALDPSDYRIAVEDAEASFARAESDYKRAQELVGDGFISRSDFDRIEAQWKNARAALDRAELDLDYTRLTASFDGTIARRYVQRFEEVQAKQAVMALQDNTVLEVRIDVPETLVLSVQPSATGRPDPDRILVTASFASRPGQEFDLTLRELATRADPETQTFEVRFTMPAPQDFVVLPGMTATVTLDLSRVMADEAVVFLPAGAVTADASLAPFVWVVDESTLRVSKATVEVGRMAGANIEIIDGLEPGSRVVVAGVGYLADDMEVRLLPEREEAEPRAEDVSVLTPAQ